MENGYSIFLMLELARLKKIVDDELEYDLMWAEGLKLYGEFVTSKFNVDNNPLYECMIEFLNSKIECVFVYKGKKYPKRTFICKESDGAETTRVIATQSLSNAMGKDKEIEGSEANDIDCEIYYYVEDDVIKLSGKEICLLHLDEPMEFIEEEF